MTTQNKFAFFANFSEAIKALPEEKQAGAYQAICEYGIYGTLPTDPMYLGLCLMAKASIYKEDGRSNNGGNHNPKGINQHSENGQSGQSRSILVNSGQSGQTSSIPLETETETRNKKQETEVEKETVKEKVDKSPIRFHKPTLDEVREYIKQKGYSFSAEQFYAYYESNGWKVGRNPMKDWKMACVTWQAKEKQPKQIGIDEEANMSKEERFQLFLKRCGVSESGGAV